VAAEDEALLPPAAILLATCGTGKEVLEAHPVVTDPSWSCLKLWASGDGSLAASAPSKGLPSDWQLLHTKSGLQSFIVVPIGPVVKPWGALMIASEACVNGPRWSVWPSMAAVALVHHVRHWQSAAVGAMLREAAAATDQIAMIGSMLRVSSSGLAG